VGSSTIQAQLSTCQWQHFNTEQVEGGVRFSEDGTGVSSDRGERSYVYVTLMVLSRDSSRCSIPHVATCRRTRTISSCICLLSLACLFQHLVGLRSPAVTTSSLCLSLFLENLQPTMPRLSCKFTLAFMLCSVLIHTPSLELWAALVREKAR
jgi:hypothetical protein